MGWSEHRAGLWRLSIFSRVCEGDGASQSKHGPIWVFPQGVDRMYTSRSPVPAGRHHTQAILHTPRPRKGLGAWSTKVSPPSHGVRAQGAWS
jgi:hypothetical protein